MPERHCGSSPHTRGARPGRSRGSAGPRIIPAYAGSTVAGCFAAKVERDHPRIRGEHVPVDLADLLDPGSSPHTRGAHPGNGLSSFAERIIPAYAGSTLMLEFRTRRMWDHPRIRGEHGPMSSLVGQRLGSSPHTRGARGASGARIVRGGIIPAYAGSTLGLSELGVTGGDHPRIRGEHSSRRSVMRPIGGSSPHTRGARGGVRAEESVHRIIPAYAGSTLFQVYRERHGEDHPRIRGEHRRGLQGRRARGGSSPHTRGARYRR